MAHRSSDARDAMAEMAERAQAISQEAGTKIAAAMKDVISAAAGLAGFAVESARDLVQYMVRRGQMTQDEADKLIREAEDAHGRRAPRPAIKPPPERAAPKSEAAREAVRREPPKSAANATPKRVAASAILSKPETTEKPEKAEKTRKVEKKDAKRPAAQKKSASKRAASKKRR
jgi:polyhydroxyalkanoate synthesis regulator phasin